MSDLFRRLRRRLGDPSGETWEDSDLEDALGNHVLFLPGVALNWTPATDGTDGVVYIAPERNFGTAVLRNANGQTLTADFSDLGRGKWQFNTAPGQTVYLAGDSYDLDGVEADLRQMNLPNLAKRFDTTDASGSTMKRNQVYQAEKEIIKTLRSKQRSVSVSSIRSDVG